MTGNGNPEKTSDEGLPFRLEGGIDYPLLKVSLARGKALQVRCSSVAGMEGDLEIFPQMNALTSRVITGDSLFVNRFQAANSAGSVLVAPPLPGRILHHSLNNECILYLRKSAFLASVPDLQLVRQPEPPQGFATGTGLVLLQCKGTGDLWFNSYGAAHIIDVNGEVVVDADKIVAWTEGLICRLEPLKGYRTSWLIGEAPCYHFQGQGRVWLQSRCSRALSHRARKLTSMKP